jgi:hypothetical protein
MTARCCRHLYLDIKVLAIAVPTLSPGSQAIMISSVQSRANDDACTNCGILQKREGTFADSKDIGCSHAVLYEGVRHVPCDFTHGFQAGAVTWNNNSGLQSAQLIYRSWNYLFKHSTCQVHSPNYSMIVSTPVSSFAYSRVFIIPACPHPVRTTSPLFLTFKITA